MTTLRMNTLGIFSHALLLLFFTQTNAVGQVGAVIDGEEYRGDYVVLRSAANTVDVFLGVEFDHSAVGTANVYGGQLLNYYSTIGTANVYGGRAVNCGGIDTLNLFNEGGVGNFSGTIGTVNIKDNGILWNENGYIGAANVYHNGLLENDDTSPTAGGKTLIGTLNLFDGTVVNSGRINEMTYFGGEYKRRDPGLTGWGNYRDRIGTLTLAGNATGILDWGNVENLQFADNGSGILCIFAFTDGAEFGFKGIQAESVNLSHGNIWLDLSGIGTFSESWENTFTNLFADGGSLADLFGLDTIDGTENLNSLTAFWGNGEYLWFTILSEGVFVNDDWNFLDGQITWNGNFDNVRWATPEPGTLAVLGLGLAGLAAARRRRK